MEDDAYFAVALHRSRSSSSAVELGTAGMNAASISAIAALCGSMIGALASSATTWLTQHHQDERRRRERMVVEFIDLSSKAFVDALLPDLY